jgi:KUP system potassium uptake protein
LFRCSDADGGEHRDNSYYKRENTLMVIGSQPLRRHAAT